MKRAIFIFLLFSFYNLNAQKSYIHVLGRYSYTNYATKYILEIKKSELYNTSLFDSLKNEIKNNNIRFQIKNYISNDYTNLPEKYLDFITFNLKDFLKVKEIFYSNNFTAFSEYFEFKPHDFQEEDNKAIFALRDAIQKATAIANRMGKKIKVVNIDDEVKRYLFYTQSFNIFPKNECQEKVLELLLEFFYSDKTKINGYRYSSQSTSSTYALWVTFELKKK